MSKSKISTKDVFYRILPYVGVFLVILATVIIGSIKKETLSSTSINMAALADNDYQMSADQISEMYTVANVSDAIELASTDTVSSNYVISSVMRENGQANTSRIDKPNIVNTAGISKGVIHYTVVDGDTARTIATSFGLTVDQVRWSNGLRDENITPGQNLVLPTEPGIVYTIKAGDTFEGIVTRYGSSKSEILAVNDLGDVDTPTEGAQITIPGGVLPVGERPESSYPAAAAQAAARAASSRTYTYSGSTSGRENMHVVSENVWTDPGNRMTPGQCVWYAWWWRKHSPLSLGALPDGMMGSANVWASVLAGYGFRVDRIPQVGAVFQTSVGYYGHVGVVIGINSDGSILVREMNYGGRAFVVTESTIPANQVGNFNYIH